MKERVHEQISTDLNQLSRMDTTVSIIAIVVTFILFGVCAAFAANSVDTMRTYTASSTQTTYELRVYAVAAMFIGVIAILVIDLYTIFSLRNNAAKKARLAESLAGLYQEDGLHQYSAENAIAGYNSRRGIFSVIIAVIGAISIIIPLIIFINAVVKL
jgi:hypothetical protein